MSDACETYREQIELYQSGLLEDKQAIGWLLEHLQGCPACSARLEELQQEDRDLDRWVESLEPVIAAGQEESIQALRGLEGLPTVRDRNGFMKVLRSEWMRTASAAVILIAAGFLAGRLSTPAVDTEQLAASLRPAMQEQLVPAVLDQLRPDLAQGFSQLKEDVADQMTDELQTYSRQTLAASNYQMNQRLQELIDAIARAQAQDRQWLLSSLDQIERNRMQDRQQMQEGLATFAAATSNELARTQEKIDSLIGSGGNQ